MSNYKKITEDSYGEYYLDYCVRDGGLIVWGLPDDTGPLGEFDARKVYEFLKEIYGET